MTNIECSNFYINCYLVDFIYFVLKNDLIIRHVIWSLFNKCEKEDKKYIKIYQITTFIKKKKKELYTIVT